MKKRNIKKIVIVSTSIGLVALTPVCPVATLSVFGAACWTSPMFIYNNQVKKEGLSKTKTLSYKREN